jgi:hypothetical protein
MDNLINEEIVKDNYLLVANPLGKPYLSSTSFTASAFFTVQSKAHYRNLYLSAYHGFCNLFVILLLQSFVILENIVPPGFFVK